jgi:hypothetical protein
MYRTMRSQIVCHLLRAALALASAAALTSQEPPDSPPAAIALESPPAAVVTTFDAGGHAEVGFSGTTTYGLRLAGASAGTQTNLQCTADPVALQQRVWSRVTGACRLLISAKIAAGDPVRLVRLNISRAPYAAGETLPGSTPAREIEIRAQAPKIAPPETRHASSVYVYGAAAAFALAILAALVLFLRRRPGTAPGEDAITDPAPEDAPEAHPHMSGADVPEEIRMRLRALEERLEADQKARSAQNGSALDEVVHNLGHSAALLVDEARRLHSTVAQRAEEFRRYMEETSQLRHMPPERLASLLAAVPDTALIMPVSPQKNEAIAAQFDAAVRTCVREMPVVRAELEPMARTLSRVVVPLDSLHDAGTKLQNRALMDRLADVRAEIRNISQELDAALAGAGSDRVCLYFRLELSTLGSTEQNLSSELANSLRKQLVRLADPVHYFGMRFELTIGQALQEVIDCCDTILDPGRRIDGVQKQIAAFAAEADATLLDPRPGTPLLDNEHMVFGVVSCTNPGDRPDHISALRVRGIRRRGQVLRKASVTIFS